MRPALILLLAMAGCAARHEAPMMTRGQLGNLVGVTEAQLVHQLGVPTRSYVLDNSKVLEYDRTRMIWGFGEPMGGPLGMYQPDKDLDAPYSGVNPWTQPEPSVRVCDVMFEIAAGRVQSFRQRGNACT